jgi:hypothetical protein
MAGVANELNTGAAESHGLDSAGDQVQVITGPIFLRPALSNKISTKTLHTFSQIRFPLTKLPWKQNALLSSRPLLFSDYSS